MKYKWKHERRGASTLPAYRGRAFQEQKLKDRSSTNSMLDPSEEQQSDQSGWGSSVRARVVEMRGTSVSVCLP